ncbi:hypothetical protein [Bradyrhizobium sp. WSM3983]|uniref:hypothetical protein n=1 Tax=Bradyrhizobium sp. WSM3983 TaxID=1038867 RepID=UPI0004230F36|nr:hypothetical protein [Bradyrhizobium sp. WSM3983]
MAGQKVEKLRKRRIRLYNQFPLLRNTNDHHLVLYQLLEMLDEMGVRNLSIFIPDPINFSAAFRVRLNRVWRIADHLNVTSRRALYSAPKSEKQREKTTLQRMTAISKFARDGSLLFSPDSPEHLDIPGKIDFMLWKEGGHNG